MGQLLSSEEFSQLEKAVGSVIYDAMLDGDAIPDLGVAHPLLLANQNEESVSQTCLQEHLQQLQSDIGNRAPTYLRDLIGRLSAFSDEPRLAGLVGLLITIVMDMAYTSKSRGKGGSAGSLSCQRIWELQEVMEEYLKRCRISLSDKSRLIQDSIRLEAQVSLLLTQLKTCLLRGDCDSRSLRHWACGAVFHTQMLVHLACLEDKAEPSSARAALDQYKEDLKQIIPAYRSYKSNTISVVKCRGGLLANFDPSRDVPEDGTMTGLTVTDRETGKSVTIPVSVMEAEIGRRREISEPDDRSTFNLDRITTDQYTQSYLDHLFSSKGPVAELENYLAKASERLGRQRADMQSKNKTEKRKAMGQSEEGHLSDKDVTEHADRREIKDEANKNCEENSLKLSIVETRQEESLNQTHHSSSNE